MKLTIYGSGCKTCKLLFERVSKIIKENNITAEIIYETNLNNIINRGIIQTPALEIDEKIVLSGRVPKEKDILNLILNNK
jgi:small redox-active disulfide protein 2